MKTVVKLLALLLTVAAVLIPIRSCAGGERVLRISDGQVIDLDRLVAEVGRSRLIFIGESHDRKDIHKVQLEIIRKLHEAGTPFAIGLEMFTAGRQEALDRWVAGKLGQDDFMKQYYRDWEMPWSLYRDIFRFARAHRIPLIGLNIPRAVTRKVAREGFAALTPDELRQLPSGVTCSVDPLYHEFIRMAYAEHTGGGNSFDHFCEAQMLWNKSMGRHLREFLDRNPRTTVVVLAGVGHAMKRGIPDEVFTGDVDGYKVILPELPQLDRSRVTGNDADYLLLFGRGS